MGLDNSNGPDSTNETYPVMSQADTAAVASAAFGAASPIAGTSSTIVSTGGAVFNLLFDAAASAAPASFRTAIAQAAALLSQAISNKITLNIKIDYSGAGGGASAAPDAGRYLAYSTVRADLIAGAVPGDTTFNALPGGTTIQGQAQVAVWNAQLKLFGVLGANDTTTDDGSANFATDIAQGDIVGVALHELTHALGRVPHGPPNDTAPDIFDLFRFTGPGTRLFSDQIPSPGAYFSVDGGTTKLADYGLKSDPSDFLNSGVQGQRDPFNEFYDAATSQSLSSIDLEQLDALGFNVVTSTNLTIALNSDTGASPTDLLTNTPTLTGVASAGRTVTVFDNGLVAGSAIATAAGIWTVTPALADGTHAITASEVNNLGQTVTASLNFWLATKAPSLSAAASVAGQTNQTSVTIAGSVAAESVGANTISGVEIFDGTADLGAAALSGSAWTFTAQKLRTGAHNFTAKATDLAGNVASSALPQVVVGASNPTNAYILSAFDVAGPGVTDTRPKGINNLGEIVGYYVDGRADDIGADGQTYYEHGFYSTISGTGRQSFSIEDPDSPIDVSNGEPSGPDRTRAFSVNDKGDIVGWYSQDETGISSAGTSYVLPDAGYIYSASWPGTFGKLGFTALNDFGTHTLGINSIDQIVGYYNDGSGNQHGFLRNFTGYGIRGDYISFDPAGSINTVAEGINDSGEIVGFYQAADQSYHGFSYDAGTQIFSPLDVNGATGTQAYGVNNAGKIVGDYFDAAGKRHGFVTNTAGQVTTIDNPNAGPGGTLVGGINNAGRIVGWYTGADGHDHGFTGLTPAKNDFNGDGTSDHLWRNTAGTVVQWTTNGLNAVLGGDANWSVVATADFNGDGNTDILWRNSGGAVIEWDMSDHAVIGAGGLGGDLNWSVVGTGDFNGDGKADILWRNASGLVLEWQMDGRNVVSSGVLGGDPNWSIVGTGDFNGDGKTDILWRNTNGTVVEWDMDGRTVLSAGTIGSDPNWTFVATGDFNGDGKSDILWRNVTTGNVLEWDMNDRTVTGAGIIGGDTNWKIVQTGDFNGDGRDDILWQNSAGLVVQWDMNGRQVLSSQVLGGDANWRIVA